MGEYDWNYTVWSKKGFPLKDHSIIVSMKDFYKFIMEELVTFIAPSRIKTFL